MKNLLLLLSIVLLSFHFNAKEVYSVIAKNGLIIRSKPDANSKRIGKYICGVDVILIEKTNIPFSIINTGDTINGYWYKVKSEIDTSGYVFSGYLFEKPISYSLSMGGFSKIEYENFDFKISNFCFYMKNKNFVNNNFIAISEGVGEYVNNDLIQIDTKKETNNITISYTCIETVKGNNNAGAKYDWTGSAPYKTIKRKNKYFFRLPDFQNSKIRESTATKLNLGELLNPKGSPNTTYSEGGGWFPIYNWNGVTVVYLNTAILLKIDIIYKDKTTETKIISIWKSYGC